MDKIIVKYLFGVYIYGNSEFYQSKQKMKFSLFLGSFHRKHGQYVLRNVKMILSVWSYKSFETVTIVYKPCT